MGRTVPVVVREGEVRSSGPRFPLWIERYSEGSGGTDVVADRWHGIRHGDDCGSSEKEDADCRDSHQTVAAKVRQKGEAPHRQRWAAASVVYTQDA